MSLSTLFSSFRVHIKISHALEDFFPKYEMCRLPSTENLLEMQIFEPHSRSTESETEGGALKSVFWQALQIILMHAKVLIL